MHVGPRPYLIILLVALLVGALPALASNEYRIGSGDVLKIVVWGHDNLSGDYTVDAQGIVPFPLVGRLPARGTTVTELAARLTGLLEKDYLVSPQVMITVKEYLSQKVQIIGETERPGLFYLTGPTTVLEALAKAGGLTKAAGRHLLLVRVPRDGQAAGSSVTQRLDLEKLRAGDTSEDVPLLDGDTIVVPRAQRAFFVQGEVGRPGVFPLDRDMTVMDAVTIAGGFTDKAAPSNMRLIRRGADGKQETVALSLAGAAADGQVRIEDGDTVLVPRGNAFFVFGEVKRPGAYQLDKSTTILEAIVVAGGFTDKAAPGRTRVIRNGPNGQQQILSVDMNDVIRRGQREKAILLQENDVVVVPESFF